MLSILASVLSVDGNILRLIGVEEDVAVRVCQELRDEIKWRSFHLPTVLSCRAGASGRELRAIISEQVLPRRVSTMTLVAAQFWL
jgi:hypothetical protein